MSCYLDQIILYFQLFIIDQIDLLFGYFDNGSKFVVFLQDALKYLCLSFSFLF